MDFHDAISSWSHLLTAAWACFAGLFLLRISWDQPRGRWACGIFAVATVLLYLASGLFHGIGHKTPESKLFFQKLDMSSIFLFVAAAYTPVMGYLLRGRRRVIYLSMMWMCAAIGIFSLWCLPMLPYVALLSVYFIVTTIGILPTRSYARIFGRHGVTWVFAIYSVYITGAIIETIQFPVLLPGLFGPHEILHLADSTGTILHFLFVVKIVTRCSPYELAKSTHRKLAEPARRSRRVANETEHSLSPTGL